MTFKRAKRAIAQTSQATVMNRLSPASRAAIFYSTDPGVPLAKPRSTQALRRRPLRGLRHLSINELIQSFLKSLARVSSLVGSLTHLLTQVVLTSLPKQHQTEPAPGIDTVNVLTHYATAQTQPSDATRHGRILFASNATAIFITPVK